MWVLTHKWTAKLFMVKDTSQTRNNGTKLQFEQINSNFDKFPSSLLSGINIHLHQFSAIRVIHSETTATATSFTPKFTKAERKALLAK